jgi:hypothetical protein
MYKTNQILRDLFDNSELSKLDFAIQCGLKGSGNLHVWLKGDLPLSYNKLAEILDNLKIKFEIVLL